MEDREREERREVELGRKAETKRTGILWSMTVCVFFVFAVLIFATTFIREAKISVDNLKNTLASQSFAHDLGKQFADGAITSVDPWLREAIVRAAAELDKDVDGEKSKTTRALERLRSFVREGDQETGKPTDRKVSGGDERKTPKQEGLPKKDEKKTEPSDEGKQEEKKATENPLSEDDLFKAIE